MGSKQHHRGVVIVGCWLLLLLMMSTAAAFQPPRILAPVRRGSTSSSSSCDNHRRLWALSSSSQDDADGDIHDPDNLQSSDTPPTPTPVQQHRPWRRRWMTTPTKKAVASMVSGLTILTTLTLTTTLSPPAHASAPVMALPKPEERDPVRDALAEQDRRATAAAQAELRDMAQQARAIQAAQGDDARQQFEQAYAQSKQQAADAKRAAREQLQRDLLQQGICPFTDLEGQRQLVLLDRGIDLAKVSGAPHFIEARLQDRSPQQSVRVTKAPHRKMIAGMVQELQNRDQQDPLEYFEKHQDKTKKIMALPYEQAVRLAAQYEANLELYGQVTVPAEGQISVKEQMEQRAASPEALKAQAKAAKQAAKAQAKAEKEAAKAQVKAAKEAAKAEKEAAKAQAKAAKEAAKAEQEAAKAEQEAAKLAAAAATPVAVETAMPDVEEDEAATVVEEDEEQDVATTTTSVSSSQIPVVPAAAAGTLVLLGGGGYGIKVMKDRSAAAEAERQRQFKLLMGDDTAASSDDDDGNVLLAMDDDDDPIVRPPKAATPTTTTPTPTTPTPTAPTKKKKKLGFFGRKKSDRETDLNVLLTGPDATFATLLAKILTYGAPGRFPQLENNNGVEDPFAGTAFDLATAQALLTQACQTANLELPAAAEIFANVVHAMLTDMVDLASSSLKEKSDSVTVKSIDIVVDFMNHAASLYDAVAPGVVITPVTYGGDLSKSKLEQMFSTYAVSGMMSLFGDGSGDNPDVASDFDARVALLQDVFQINEKKAEGLMMKAVQKNMMEMMKSGKGMEGMEQMMQGMGGMDGMEGLMGDNGEGPSPEQLKEMLVQLKAMKDSGSIPPDQFEEVKKQFKDAFGASLDDVVKDASGDGGLSSDEAELLSLMKSIMED